jgi:hypothetical protein
VRAGYGLVDRPVIVCVSRLVPRKGQDTLIRALPAIRRGARTRAAAGRRRALPVHIGDAGREHGVAAHVVFTGSVPWAELPAHYAAGDVFAMPCRTRRRAGRGGLGIVYLEASATGLPVVGGDSGGAPTRCARARPGTSSGADGTRWPSGHLLATGAGPRWCGRPAWVEARRALGHQAAGPHRRCVEEGPFLTLFFAWKGPY